MTVTALTKMLDLAVVMKAELLLKQQYLAEAAVSKEKQFRKRAVTKELLHNDKPIGSFGCK